jgi:hypothetical protein
MACFLMACFADFSAWLFAPVGVAQTDGINSKEEAAMVRLQAKKFSAPDEVREFKGSKGRIELVEMDGNTIGLGRFEPGWR